MKKHVIIIFALVASTVLLTTCDKVDEIPPITESTTNKTYRMPDPVPLSAEESALVEQIRQEYRNSLPD
jgi:hypothetical protein